MTRTIHDIRKRDLQGEIWINLNDLQLFLRDHAAAAREFIDHIRLVPLKELAQTLREAKPPIRSAIAAGAQAKLEKETTP